MRYVIHNSHETPLLDPVAEGEEISIGVVWDDFLTVSDIATSTWEFTPADLTEVWKQKSITRTISGEEFTKVNTAVFSGFLESSRYTITNEVITDSVPPLTYRRSFYIECKKVL